MKKLLVICPSRARVNRLMDMIKSFNKTVNSEHTDLLILLDKDDSSLEEYLNKIPLYIRFQVFDRTDDKTLTTEIINRVFELNKEYEFYSVTNDDIEYVVEGWDEALCVKNKLSSGREYHANKRFGDYRRKTRTHKGVFPYTSVICGDLVRKVGWLQYPGIVHSHGDGIWYNLVKKLEVFNPNPKYLYIHHSHYYNDGEYDETARRTDCFNALEEDFKISTRWKHHKMMDLIKRIKEDELCQQDLQDQKVIQPIV